MTEEAVDRGDVLEETAQEEEGRRARKKAATRRALHEAAARMFEERGYQETTVKDIAAAAGVTERTFFRYFPSKEDLIFAEVLDLLPLLRQEILRRPAGEPPLTAVLNSLIKVAGERDAGLAILFVDAPPRALSTGGPPTHVLTDFEDGIAVALTTRFTQQTPEAPPDRRALRASVLARASVAAVRSAMIARAARINTDPHHRSVDDFAVLLEEAFDVLRAAT